MYILVIDPNDPLAMLLTEELKRLDYDVDQFATSAEALEAAQARAPDLAMLDMALTDPDTTTLAKQLRELDPDMRLMLTPFMGEQPVLEDADISIQGVLPKPFFLPDLPSRMQAALEAPLDGGVLVEQPAEEEAEAPPPESEARVEPATQPPSHSEREAPPSAESKLAIEPSPAQIAEEGAFSYEVFNKNRAQVERWMGTLAQEVGADAVLLTFGGGLLTWVGGLTQPEAESISRAVVHGWRTSAEVARILGREQVRFEQSISGDDYMLYALSVEVNAIMAVAVRGSAPLGLLRHRARSTVDQIAQLCTA